MFGELTHKPHGLSHDSHVEGIRVDVRVDHRIETEVVLALGLPHGCTYSSSGNRVQDDSRDRVVAAIGREPAFLCGPDETRNNQHLNVWCAWPTRPILPC